VDKISCRPDFAVRLSSGYFKVAEGLSLTVRVVHGAPPMFLDHATDDPSSDPEHSVTFYLALKRAGVPAELHLYASGGHGFGVRKVAHPCATWTYRWVDWLRAREILK
jgi:acetyl esterase/lipase